MNGTVGSGQREKDAETKEENREGAGHEVNRRISEGKGIGSNGNRDREGGGFDGGGMVAHMEAGRPYLQTVQEELRETRMKGEEVKWEAENRKTEETSETCERDGSEPKSEDIRVTEKTCHTVDTQPHHIHLPAHHTISTANMSLVFMISCSLLCSQ